MGALLHSAHHTALQDVTPTESEPPTHSVQRTASKARFKPHLPSSPLRRADEMGPDEEESVGAQRQNPGGEGASAPSVVGLMPYSSILSCSFLFPPRRNTCTRWKTRSRYSHYYVLPLKQGGAVTRRVAGRANPVEQSAAAPRGNRHVMFVLLSLVTVTALIARRSMPAKCCGAHLEQRPSNHRDCSIFRLYR